MRILIIGLFVLLGCGDNGGGGEGDSGMPMGTAAFTETVTFRIVESVELKGDVLVPEGEGPHDAVVLIHGGAFVTGDKDEGPTVPWEVLLQEEGYVAFNVNYRLAGDFSSTPHFPGPLQDIKCAIQWLRNEASRFRGISNVYVLGGSAGGYYSSMAGVTGDLSSLDPTGCPEQSNAVDGVISFFGIHDFGELAASPLRDEDNGLAEPEAAFVGRSCRPAEDACNVASSVSYIGTNTPKFFLSHSKDDPTIPVSQTRQFHSKLQASSLNTTFTEINGQGHGWYGNFNVPIVADVRDEVLEWLKR